MSAPGESEVVPVAPGERLVRRIGLVAGPIAAAAVALALPGLDPKARLGAAIATLMAAWWMTEALPMWATACIPIVVFPVAGVVPFLVTAKGQWLGKGTVGAIPWDPLILLLAGGMWLARGLETTGLHRRLALLTVHAIGATPRRLVLAVLVAACMISVWISNSATALLLYPIAVALVERGAPPGPERRALGGAVMLALAYGANAGGAGSLIGTPANMMMAVAPLEAAYRDAPRITFPLWLGMGLPFVFCFIPLAWIYLSRIAFRLPAGAGAGAAVSAELAALGPPSRRERAVASVFFCAVAAWVTGASWGKHAGLTGLWPDTLVALVAAGALALLPLGVPGARLILPPRELVRLPWGLLVLIAGGIVLSGGFQASGLTDAIARALAGASGVPPVLLVAATSLAVVTLTALTSNTGTAQIVGPVLAAAAPALGVDPRLLLLPAALAVSCDFALPVGTPPNAIVFAGGYVTLGKMARTGVVMDVLAAALVTIATFAVACPVFGIDPWGGVPVWARR